MLDEMIKLKNRINFQIPENNGTTMVGHLSRKRSAELKLPEVKREYRMALIRHIVPIVVTGSLSEDFAKTAISDLGILVVDGEAIYKDLLNRMPKEASSGKMSTKVVVDVMSRHFMDIASECEVAEYPEILYKNNKSFAINNKQDLEKMIKRSITDNVGAEMTLVYNLRSISEKAMDIGFDGKKSQLPVLILVNDESLVDSISKAQKDFVGSSYLLTAGNVSSKLKTRTFSIVEEVTKETVSEALKSVKNYIKKGKKL